MLPKRNLGHFFVVLCVFTFIIARSWIIEPLFERNKTEPEIQSLFYIYFVTFLRFFFIVGFPMVFSNLLGLVLFNTSASNTIRINSSPLLAPLICFRVVTRGLYPEFVRQNVKTNLSTCLKAGLENFMFEVVTDHVVNLPRLRSTREIVVPAGYRTARGSLFKARALHYCNEEGINQLNGDDWIAHLDEETLLTEASVIGVLNFVSEGNSHFGQGVITYASGDVVNWLTTLIDSVRVGIDYGSLRFTLKVLRKPFLNWKGSYVVANAAAEHDVSFDHGPAASVAEDCFFGAVATMKGYKFDFIEGEMLEQSTFTFLDFIRQRRRWYLGIYLTCISPEIPLRHKIGICWLIICVLAMPLSTIGCILGDFFPVSQYLLTNIIQECTAGVYIFLFVFGTYKSIRRRRYHPFKQLFFLICTLCVIPLSVVLENIASVWTSVGKKEIGFHVVSKDPSNHRTSKRFTESVV